MRVDLYGLGFEAPGVTVYLWSPWRASALEHRLFDSLKSLPGITLEKGGDELRLQIGDAKLWRSAVQTMSRVLKGWQEESADAGGTDRRSWRWMVEGDVEEGGFDHNGEPAAVWLFLRLGLDRGSPGEFEKGEDIDLDWFGVCVWGNQDSGRG